jgi:DNA-binding transcriptional LysR family regulator
MDISVTGLRILREVAERGSFTAAAAALGYTQSAVSRQVATLESTARTQLFERHPAGVRLTPAGGRLLRHAAVVLDEIETATRELAGATPAGGRIRLGVFAAGGAVLLPRALTILRRTNPLIEVTTREGSTPVLVRGLRAGTLDLAVVASAPPFRPPDGESPPLRLETLTETSLSVAMAAGHPLAGGDTVTVDELQGQRWIASTSTGSETLLGVWPGLSGRPVISHTARDWMTKLQLVAAGCGLTTLPAVLKPVVPPGVRVLAVRGGPLELRRTVLARLPGTMGRPADALREALRAAAADTRNADIRNADIRNEVL